MISTDALQRSLTKGSSLTIVNKGLSLTIVNEGASLTIVNKTIGLKTTIFEKRPF